MLKYLLYLSLPLVPLMASAAPPVWKTLTPGVSYTFLPKKQQGKVHAFQINLNKQKLSLISTSTQQQPFFVKPIAIKNNALLAINGGFFSPDFKPLGLRIHQGKIVYPLKNISWWGIFVLNKNRPSILSQKSYRYTKTITFALQAGPRLIVNGKIPSLKNGLAKRSAIGITKKGTVIIAISENPMTTTELAHVMKTDLACYNALNLDGGSSSQLYAQVGNFTLNLTSLRPVADALLVNRQ